MAVGTAMIFGLVALMFLDTSINMAMQPFKMLVGDMVNEKQKGLAYSIQSFLCNAGSLMGYLFPFIFTFIGISNTADKGTVPDSVIYSFYIGAAILILCVIYTTVKVKEMPPKEFEEFHGITADEKKEKADFISLLKPEAPIGTSVVDSNGEQVVQDEQQVIVNLQAPTKEQIENLPEGSVNEEYAAYYEANKDFVGWITINGTNVDYPVVQGEDNLFYLHHNFNGEEEFAGTIFTDYEGKFGPNQMPNNTILYGHNMLYKYKFSALNNYNNNIDFLRETPVVDFNTLYQDNKYKIFSVFITNTDEEHGDVFDYTKYVYFKNSDEFYEYIKEVMDRSKYNTGVDVEYGDELLTLSTCDGSTGFENMRLVIVARKVRENESPDVDTSKITRKDSIKYFKAYTDVYGDKWKGRTWDISLVKGMKEYLEDNGLMDDPSNY